MIKIKKIVFMLSIIFLFIPLNYLTAGPTVIQDDRVTNLATTPVLGRGYSLSTNTFQSTCLQDLVMTQPSYDFSYIFQEMDSFLETNSTENNALEKHVPKPFKNYVARKVYESEVKKGMTATERAKTKTTKSIMATINLHSYYASVDESASRISDSAAKLLTGNDIPGFFNSCGSYYVRSIGRKAQFIAMFEFEASSDTEDKSFVYELETQIKSFRKKVVTQKTNIRRSWDNRYGWFGQRRSKGSVNYSSRRDTVTWEQDPNESSTEVLAKDLEDSFSKSASGKKLTITATAFGLGKNENASLISYDIETFKSAVKDAFLSMQNPKTGKVDSIEVIPWVENTEFQSLIELEEEVEAESTTTISSGDETSETTNDSKKLLLYEKKFLLNVNAEFLAEVLRSDRAMLNLYYKAKLCKKNIDSKWMRTQPQKKGSPAGGKKVKEVKPNYAKRYLMNNRYKDSGILLSDFAAYLSDARVKGLLAEHKSFMYGDEQSTKKWGQGAKACMNGLMKPRAIFTVNYRNIEACQKLEDNLGQIEESIVENHCMPRLFSSFTEPKEITSATSESSITSESPTQ